MMMASRVLYRFLWGVVLGVAGASFFVWSGMVWAVLACAVALAVVWRGSRQTVLVACVFFGIAFGWWRLESDVAEWNVFMERFEPFSVVGEAVALGDARAYGRMRSAPMRFVSCDPAECPGHDTLALFPATEHVRYGDRVRLSCRLELPENFDPMFDYRMFLAKEGIGTVCRVDRAERIGRDRSVMASIASGRGALEKNMDAALPEPENGLLQGLLFGGSGRLSADMRDRFARTGLTHIVAVSGQNVMLVAEIMLLSLIAIGLWRRQAFWAALFGIWIFVIGTGAEASAVRAGIMGTLGFMALNSGRLAVGRNLVILAAAGMLLVNPLLLRYDIGFQLSFLATITLLAVFRPDQISFREGMAGTVKEIVVATLAIELMTAPILLYDFGFVSLVAVVANVLVLPVVPLAMGFGFATAVSGWILPASVNVFGWLAYLSGAWIIGVVRIFSNATFATLTWKISPGTVFLWYAVLGGAWAWAVRRKRISKEI